MAGARHIRDNHYRQDAPHRRDNLGTIDSDRGVDFPVASIPAIAVGEGIQDFAEAPVSDNAQKKPVEIVALLMRIRGVRQ